MGRWGGGGIWALSAKIPTRSASQQSGVAQWEPVLPRSSVQGGHRVIRTEAWPFYRTVSGVRIYWVLEEPKGPKGLRGFHFTKFIFQFPLFQPLADTKLGHVVQGYLAHKSTPTHLGPPWDPTHRPTVGSWTPGGGCFLVSEEPLYPDSVRCEKFVAFV